MSETVRLECEGGVPTIGFISCPACGATADDFCAVADRMMTRDEAQEQYGRYRQWRSAIAAGTGKKEGNDGRE